MRLLLDDAGDAGLAGFLEETGQRAAAGTGGLHHPVVRALQAIAAALDGGAPDVHVHLAGEHAAGLDRVLAAAWHRARTERLAVEPAVRRLAGQVEREVYGPEGRPAVRLPWNPDELADGLWQPERGWEPGVLLRGRV